MTACTTDFCEEDLPGIQENLPRAAQGIVFQASVTGFWGIIPFIRTKAAVEAQGRNQHGYKDEKWKSLAKRCYQMLPAEHDFSRMMASA
jgi:hypothetical protein